MTESAAPRSPEPPWDRAPWVNWSGDIQIERPERHYYPTSREHLVAIIRDAEEAGRSVRASGSHWAFTDVAVADWLVETDRLDETITDVLPSALDTSPSIRSRHLAHVEAGITIRDLNLRLDGKDPTHPGVQSRLALATMGGASGQTILGAISTGTHGGDHALPPLADLVRAVHLVGAGGVEHWIERDTPFTLRAELERALPGVEVHYDSALLNASLVSMGRAGIVYSVVLDVVDQFHLLFQLTQSTWERMKYQLLPPFTAFDQPPPGGTGPANRAVEVSFGPYADRDGTRTCYVTRRWQVQEGDGPPPPPRGMDLFGRICAHRKVFVVAGPSLGNLIAFAVNTANRFRAGRGVRWAVGRLLRRFRPAQAFTDVGYEVMDLNELGGECYRGLSLEVAFDAFTGAPIQYLDEVLFPLFEELASEGLNLAGYVSLRFAHRSAAFLAMHRWDVTGTIEVALLGGIRGNDLALQRLQNEAVRRGGTVHWGQLNSTTKADVERMYPDLPQWRAALWRLGLRPGDRFDNDYCRTRDLEPSPG
jgi:FAD/FMN-containing dehydrogenase